MGATREELFAAVCASPSDDAPRLVYADHLLESGDDADRKHAELIIAQCTLAREARGTDAWRRARAVEKSLLGAVVRTYQGPGRASLWKRGFASYLQVAPSDLRSAGEHAPAQMPAPETLALVTFETPEEPLVTLGDLAWVRRVWAGVEKVVIVSGDGGLSVATNLLASFSEHDDTPAWPRDGIPNPRLHPAIIRLTLSTKDGARFGAYIDLDLPALDEVDVSIADPPRIAALLANRKLRRLGYLGGSGKAIAAVAAFTGFANLESFDAHAGELTPDLVDAIAASSLTTLVLRYRKRSPALADLARRIAPRIRDLHLVLRGDRVEREPIGALTAIRFEKLERLALAYFRLDAATSRLDVPRLAELDLASCDVSAEAREFLRDRGLLDGLPA